MQNKAVNVVIKLLQESIPKYPIYKKNINFLTNQQRKKAHCQKSQKAQVMAGFWSWKMFVTQTVYKWEIRLQGLVPTWQ